MIVPGKHVMICAKSISKCFPYGKPFSKGLPVSFESCILTKDLHTMHTRKSNLNQLTNIKKQFSKKKIHDLQVAVTCYTAHFKPYMTNQNVY